MLLQSTPPTGGAPSGFMNGYSFFQLLIDQNANGDITQARLGPSLGTSGVLFNGVRPFLVQGALKPTEIVITSHSALSSPITVDLQ